MDLEGQGEVRQSLSISIPPGRLEDYSGNKNTIDFSFNWIFDTISPKPVVTASIPNKTETTEDSITLFINTDFESITFNQNDIKFDYEGEIYGETFPSVQSFNKTGSTTYEAVIRKVESGIFRAFIPRGAYTAIQTDGGNLNSASNDFIWTFLGDLPVGSFSSDNLISREGMLFSLGLKTISISFETNVPIRALMISNFTHSDNLELSNFVQSSTGKTVTFNATLTDGSESEVFVSLPVSNIIGTFGRQALPPAPTLNWRTILRPNPSLTFTVSRYGNIYCSFQPITIKMSSDVPLPTESVTPASFSVSTGLIVSNIVGNSDLREWSITITPTREGTFLISVPEGSIFSADGYQNRASNILTMFVFDGRDTPELETYLQEEGLDIGCVCRPLFCPPRVISSTADTSFVTQLRGDEARRILMIRLASIASNRTRPVVETQIINEFGSNAGAPSGIRGPLRNNFV